LKKVLLRVRFMPLFNSLNGKKEKYEYSLLMEWKVAMAPN
jgi:hypothetical protein